MNVYAFGFDGCFIITSVFNITSVFIMTSVFTFSKQKVDLEHNIKCNADNSSCKQPTT